MLEVINMKYVEGMMMIPPSPSTVQPKVSCRKFMHISNTTICLRRCVCVCVQLFKRQCSHKLCYIFISFLTLRFLSHSSDTHTRTHTHEYANGKWQPAQARAPANSPRWAALFAFALRS